MTNPTDALTITFILSAWLAALFFVLGVAAYIADKVNSGD